MTCQVMLRPQTYNEVRTGQHAVVCDSCQRILYFNPAHELAANSGRIASSPPSSQNGTPNRPGTTAASMAKRERSTSAHQEPGPITRRVYDVHNGRQVGDILIREGEYHAAFPEDLADAIRLNGSWDEAGLGSMGYGTPYGRSRCSTSRPRRCASRSHRAASHPKRSAPGYDRASRKLKFSYNFLDNLTFCRA